MSTLLHVQPKRLVMVKAQGPWRIVSHPFDCRICDVTLEAIGSSPEEAERRAVNAYAIHCREFHIGLSTKERQ